MAERMLAPRQRAELVIATRDGSQIAVIHTTDQLIEAPNWSPDGEWLVFNAEGRLYRLSPDGKDGPHEIASAPAQDLNNDHVISPDGALIYASNNDGHLYRIPFEGGEAVRISNEHSPERGFRYYLHGISPDGHTLAYVGLELDGERVKTRICTLPAAGGEDVFLTDGSCPVDGPEFSPDGQFLWFNSEAAATRPGHAQIFRMRPDGTEVTRMTHDDRVNWFPHLAGDGTILCYISYPPGTEGHPADKDVIIRTMRPDGSEQRDIDRFNGGQGTINVTSWAPDSSRFAYVRYPLG